MINLDGPVYSTRKKDDCLLLNSQTTRISRSLNTGPQPNFHPYGTIAQCCFRLGKYAKSIARIHCQILSLAYCFRLWDLHIVWPPIVACIRLTAKCFYHSSSVYEVGDTIILSWYALFYFPATCKWNRLGNAENRRRQRPANATVMAQQLHTTSLSVMMIFLRRIAVDAHAYPNTTLHVAEGKQTSVPDNGPFLFRFYGVAPSSRQWACV